MEPCKWKQCGGWIVPGKELCGKCGRTGDIRHEISVESKQSGSNIRNWKTYGGDSNYILSLKHERRSNYDRRET